MAKNGTKAFFATALVGLSISLCLAASPPEGAKAQAGPATEKAPATKAEPRPAPAVMPQPAPAPTVGVQPSPGTEKPAASQGESKPAPARVAAKRSRATDRDARACLELLANIDIIRCAEKYR